MNIRILIFAFFACFTSQAFSQEDSKVSEKITIRVFALAVSGDLKSVHLRSESGELGVVSLESIVLGQRLEVSVRKFAFGVNQADGTFNSLGTVTLPEVGNDFVLVFSPTKDSYEVFPVRVDDLEFKGDNSILFNFTDYKIKVSAGESSTVVASKERGILKPAYKPEDDSFIANFAYDRNGQMMTFSNTRWIVNPNLKSIVLVFFDTNTNQPNYRSVSMLANE